MTLSKLDLNLQIAGDPSCKVISDIMHTIWSIELLGHQRHLTGSAEPEVMQSHWPHFQWYLNPFLRGWSGQLANRSSPSACPVFELICKECLCECVSTWVCTLCHLMGFVTMCACGYSLVLNPESAICQKDFFFFFYPSVLMSRKKISLSFHWLLSSLASPTFFEVMSNMENVWSIILLHLTLTLHWHLRLTVSFVCIV